MKVIIAGSRDLLDPGYIEEAVLWAPFPITEVVSGGARGVDINGEFWAKRNGIPVKVFTAAWRDADGVMDRSAGHRRNQEMAMYADALIAIWDCESTGTADMIRRARKRKLPVHILEIPWS